MEVMGADNDLVKKILAGKSPRDRATELVHGTKLKDVAVRKQLADGGMKAIDASNDPMVELAKLVDSPARRVRRPRTVDPMGPASSDLFHWLRYVELSHRAVPIHTTWFRDKGIGSSPRRRRDVASP